MSTPPARIPIHELEYLPAISALPAIAVRYFHRIGRESDLPADYELGGKSLLARNLDYRIARSVLLVLLRIICGRCLGKSWAQNSPAAWRHLK
jgi:hypothetical protein